MTLLYSDSVDLDLHFECYDGKRVNYLQIGKPFSDCNAYLDADMAEANEFYERSDGTVGQIETIVIQKPRRQTAYSGFVHYFTPELKPVDFTVRISGE